MNGVYGAIALGLTVRQGFYSIYHPPGFVHRSAIMAINLHVNE